MFRLLIITILFFLIGLTQPCFANLSLSVEPIDGSSSLRFEKTPVAGPENKKGIRIRVISTNGSRYQVFQRLLEPLVNEQGEALNTQSLQTQTLINSNSYGTLYLQNSDYLGMSDQMVYSSAQNGQSDAFVIGYSPNHALINAGGKFRGRHVFTVRGIGNPYTDQVTIDVFLETSASFNVSVKGAHHRNLIRVRDSDTSFRKADNLSVSFSGNEGHEIRIYQEVETMPQNTTTQELSAGVLQITPQGSTEGLRLQGPAPLGVGRSLVYSSNKNEDNFNIYFSLDANKIQHQDAGFYAGKIKYVVEGDHNKQEFLVNIQCEIGPIFTVVVTPPVGGVSFKSVLANHPPQEQEIQVKVFSNLHKPYQVIQGLQASMTNKQGKEFDNKYFNFQVEIPSGQKGQTDFKEFSPVKAGEYPIYSSDARGSGTAFTVVYRLEGYAQMSPGDFSVPISISLNQK